MGGDGRVDTGLLGLAVLFTASLTASQFLAAKITAVRLPGVGMVAAPAAFFVYAATFTFTDIISEVYGRRAASAVVKLGFASQILVLLYSWAALKLPYAPFGASPEAYRAVVGSAPSIVAASLAAYAVSQTHDVWAFHWWRERTRGRWLWLRNNASTMVSQLLDTTIFITLAFSILPRVLGGPTPLPLDVAARLILGQYAVKVLVAAADTPFVYLGVYLLTRGPAAALPLRRGALEGAGGLPGRRQAWP